MGEVVCAMAMSHVALSSDAPKSEQIDNIRDSWTECRRVFEDAEPTVLVAFLDDHFENFTMLHAPTLAVGVGGTMHGPPPEYEAWLGVKRREVAGHTTLGTTLGDELVRRSFEPYRVADVELGHNLIEPLKHLGPLAEELPSVPIFINVFVPPSMSFARSYELGRAVREIIKSVPSERAAILGTGGLSHAPLYWNPERPDTDYYRRMKRYQHEGLAYLSTDPTLFTELGENEVAAGIAGDITLNQEWDKQFLEHLARGEHEQLCRLDNDTVAGEAGAGALEALTWAAVAGAAGPDARATFTSYEPVQEWMCGVGFAILDPVSARA